MSKSEDGQQGSGELFGSKTPADTKPPESSPDPVVPPVTGEEPKDTPPVVEKASADEERSKQVDVWKTRLASGEATMDQVPNWIQRELEPAKKEVDDFDTKFEQKYKEKESQKNFKRLKNLLPKLKLTEEQQEGIQKHFNEFVDTYNMPQDVALQKAMKMEGVTSRKDKDNMDLFNSMATPKAGVTPTREPEGGELTPDKIADMGSEKRLAMLEKARKSGQSRPKAPTLTNRQ